MEPPTCVMQPDCIQPACFGPRCSSSKSKKEKKAKAKTKPRNEVNPQVGQVKRPADEAIKNIWATQALETLVQDYIY
ncbi:hypothetical protein CRG98_031184 [Punica granatum]|uniref:Uncharacterized protein n=1 Tax=Punica granatum TaxID=22663 RepID=A0A2I0IWP2_PUNGR|nr:hypothetical protein CRG98_031184 [Punica granatum]